MLRHLKQKKSPEKGKFSSDSADELDESFSEHTEQNTKHNKQVKKSHSKKNKKVKEGSGREGSCQEFRCFDLSSKTDTRAGVKLLIKTKKVRSDGSNDHDPKAGGATGVWGTRIPPELLLKILQLVVSEEGSLPFLCRSTKVCKLWNQVSTHPSLWHTVDLSYGWVKSNESTLAWLCKNRLSQARDLNLSGWKALTSTGVECIAEHCSMLQSINLSYCSKLNAMAVKALTDKCPTLAGIDLSATGSDVISAATLKYLLDKCGPNLTHFNVSCNTLKGFNTVLNHIMEKCPKLELLDLSNAVFSSDFLSINIEKLQSGCPKVKVLRFTNTKVRTTYAPGKVRAEALGFPHLEQLSLASNRDGVGIGFSDDFLERVTKNATELKLLDLRGTTHITANGVHSLPILALQQLYVSNSSISKYTGIELILQKWQHSLIEVDLSWNIFPDGCVDLALEQLAAFPSTSCLNLLNLGGTSVSCQGVETVLKGCPRLKKLNLESCRGLARGMKCEYSGKKLRKLRKNIDKIIKGEAD